MGVGRRGLAVEGVAGRKGWYGVANRRASKRSIMGQAVGCEEEENRRRGRGDERMVWDCE